MNARKLLVAAVMIGAVSGAATTMAWADESVVSVDANCVPQMSSFEHRLYQKAEEGPEVLRDFIFIRRGIYPLDMGEVEAWAGHVDAARGACLKAAANASGSATVAAR